MIVYLAQDISAFVMYCVNGESGSSLLIESTNSMIMILDPTHFIAHCNVIKNEKHLKNEQKVGMLLQKKNRYKRSSMRKSIILYLLV